MAAESKLIVDFTIVLGSSALGGYIANRLRQPALLGYLASGIIVGPFGLSLLSDTADQQALAAIGVIFLLFALGVEFSINELKKVKDIALGGSLLQMGITATIVAAVTGVLGWVNSSSEGIFLGAVLSLSSTAVVLKVLTDRGETNTLHGQIMLAILIAQDLALGLMLAALPALENPANMGWALGMALVKAIAFFGVALVAGKWLIPRMMSGVAATESNELFLLTTIALCLGVALFTAQLGLSIEMGAFVAGLTIAEIDHSDQALAKVLPLRDTFASLFFASIGMLIDPDILVGNLGTILGLVVLVMVGKTLVVLPVVLWFGYSLRTAILAAFGLSQIGEFSFVLAVKGEEMGLIDRQDYLLLLGTTAIALILTPAWLNLGTYLSGHLARWPLLSRYLQRFERPKEIFMPETLYNHVVVAGYGRVGQVIVKLLQRRGYAVLVIENSEAAIRRLRSERLPYLFGDADSELVLERAHLPKAAALAIALPDPISTRLLLTHALTLAPDLDVIARAHTNHEIDVLARMGAREVVQPEFEAALELSAHILATLGESEEIIFDAINAIRFNRYLSVRSQQF